MSLLLGIELSRSQVVLTVVDRSSDVIGSISEPISEPVAHWWRCHPDEWLRGVLAVLERAVGEGLFAGEKVAAIGLSAEPGLVLLDADLKPLPPRDLSWEEILGTDMESSPYSALRALARERPRTAARVGVILGPLDYLRFRMTGSLATHVGFAWGTGLTVGAEHVTSWDRAAIQELGYPPSALPPIFEASSRVGVINEDLVRRFGIRRGVWFNAGSDPLSALLTVAVEPRTDSRVLICENGSIRCWRSSGPPADWTPRFLTTAVAGVWYENEKWTHGDPRDLESWSPPPDRSLAVYFRERQDPHEWPRELAGDLGVLRDAGGPSAGTAVQAGLAIGWWRDMRTLWRKRRPPVPYAEWRSILEREES